MAFEDARPTLSWKKIFLAVEMFGLYLSAPIVIYYLIHTARVPLFTILPFVALFFLGFLISDRKFSWTKTFFTLPRRRDLWKVLSLFIPLGGALVIWSWTVFPTRFLFLPQARPELWSAIMILYPLVSVTSQELVYRVFYFHRYAPLFERRPRLAIVVNAALFSFSHIIFAHWVSVLLTFAGGLLFAWRFKTTRTYWTSVFEHSLYGNLVFTIGLGQFFFTGVSAFG